MTIWLQLVSYLDQSIRTVKKKKLGFSTFRQQIEHVQLVTELAAGKNLGAPKCPPAQASKNQKKSPAQLSVILNCAFAEESLCTTIRRGTGFSLFVFGTLQSPARLFQRICARQFHLSLHAHRLKPVPQE
jgi:hypothetical protein